MWLTRLDAKAAKAPTLLRWSYLSLRWFLIVMGAFLAVGLAVTELGEHRVGLGTGIAVALLFGVMKGIMGAITSPGSPPAPSHRHRNG